jgi:hypothetical protein
MIINNPGKYTDLKRFFAKILIIIMHNFLLEINTKKYSWRGFGFAGLTVVIADLQSVQWSARLQSVVVLRMKVLKAISKSKHTKESL